MRAASSYFFPGVLPGDVLTADFAFPQAGLPHVLQAVRADVEAAVRLASIDQLFIRWRTPQGREHGIQRDRLPVPAM